MIVPDEIRHPKKRAFLAAYAEGGNITAAADAARMHRQRHYQWLAEDPAYAAAFEQAGEQAADRLEQEARRRATEGVRKERVFFYKGAVITDEAGEPIREVTTEYSDTLLIFLLKGVRPDKYAERRVVTERREIRERAEKLAAELDLPVEEVERDLVLGVEAARPS